LKSYKKNVSHLWVELSEDKNLPFSIQFDSFTSIVIFRDLDPDSDFYFKIESVNSLNVNNRVTYKIKYKPYTEETLDYKNKTAYPEELELLISEWRDLLQKFNEKSPIFDDTIEQSYYDEIEPQFEILDEDAGYRPYPIEQQKQIILFLKKAKEIVENENDLEVKNTVDLIEDTKNSISKLTKKEVVTKIRKIVARSFKIGIQVGEKLLIEFSTELVKKLITT
jgi:hypothetical protein